MRVLARALGDPQARFKSVLVAGTNGKGSTSATLASILSAAGHKTGLYTSPHLVRVNERMRVNGVSIADEQFASLFARVNAVAEAEVKRGALPHMPSFFEVLTAIGFQHFADCNVEITVLEVGMGGRLDATNIVEPILSVITDVSLDHQQYLGNTVTEIAREKAGILRKNGILVTLPQHPEANDAIGKVAMGLGVRGVSAVQYVPNVSPSAQPLKAVDSMGRSSPYKALDALRPARHQIGEFLRARYFLEVMGEEILLEPPLIGRHQLRNIALAVAAAEELGRLGFPVTAQQISDGVRDTHWPGRFQFVPGPGADFILDVAHNPAGAWALRSALSEQFLSE